MHDTENFKKNINEDYDIEEELGSGQFAVVRKIVEKETGDEFAAKYVRKKRTKASRNGMSREDIKREIEILRMVDSEKIIKVHDVYETDKEVILVMELLRGGELFDYISKKDFLTEEEAIDFTRQILQGLQHLHSRSVVHLDLKPENILLKNTRRKTIKLVDFGLARVVNENEQVREIMGTPEFVAPEVLNFDTISTATDMWALGVIAYILLSGASPFLGEDNQETFTNIIQVDYQFDEEYFAEISDEAKDFIRKLLVKNPRKRPTAHDCSRHTWVEEEVVDKKKKQRRRTTQICTFNFKRFVARKRWKMSYNKIRAMNLIAKMGIKPPPGFITAIPPMTDNNKETNNEPEPAEEKPPNSHKDHKKKESTIHRKKHKQSSSPKTALEKTDSLTLKTMDIDIGEGESAEPEPELVDDNETDDNVELSPTVQEPVDYGSMTKREKRRARGQLRTDEIAKSKKEVDAKQTKIETDEVVNGDEAADQVFNNGGEEASDQVVNDGEKATDQVVNNGEEAADPVVNGGEGAADKVVNGGEGAADQVVNGGEGAADQVVSGVEEAAMDVEETAPADEKPVETQTVTSTMHIEHKPQSGGILKKGGRGGRIPSTEDHYFVTLNAALLQQDDTFYHSGLQPTRRHGHGILKQTASTPPDVATKGSEEKSAPKGSGYVRKRSEDVPKSTEDVPKPSENKKVSQFTTVVQVNSGGNVPQDDNPGSGVLVGLQVDKAVAHAPDKETGNEVKPEVPKTEVKPSHHNSDLKKASQTNEATPPPKKPLTKTDNHPQQRSFTPPPWQRKSSRENLKVTPAPIHGVSKVSLKANRFVSSDKQPSPKSATNAGSVKTSNVLGKSKLFQKETNKPDIKKTAATKSNSGQELKNVACDINLDDTPAKNGAVEIPEYKTRADSQSKGRSDSQSKVGSDTESKSRSNSQLKVLSNGQTKPRSDSQSKTRSGSVKTDNIKNKNTLNGENTKKSINNAVQSSAVVSLSSVEISGGNEEQEAGTEVNEELTSLSTHSLTEFTIRPCGNSGEEKGGEEKAGGFDIMLTIAPPTDQPTQEPRAVSTMKTRFTSSSSSLPDPRAGLPNGKLTSLSTNDMTSLIHEPVTSPTTDRYGVAQGSKYTPQRDFSKYLNSDPLKPIKITGVPANTQKPSWQVKRNNSPVTVITPAKTINNPKSPTTPTARPLSFAAKSAAAKVSVAYVPRRSFGFTPKTGNQSEMVVKPSEPEEAPKLNNNDESKRWSQTSYTSDRSGSSASSDELSLSNVTDENTALNRMCSNEQISKNPEICRKIENHSGKLSPNASPVLQKKWKATLVLPKESEKVPSGKDRDIRISSTNAPRKNKFTNVRSMWEKK